MEFFAQINVMAGQRVEKFWGPAGWPIDSGQQRFDALFPQHQIRTHRPHAAGITDIAAGFLLAPHQLFAA